jgi:hypothetical protein
VIDRLNPNDIRTAGSTVASRDDRVTLEKMVTNRLNPNETLAAGNSIASQDNRFTLIMQQDNNLVLYKAGAGPLWASNTVGSNGTRAIMQDDGNLVIYDANGHPVWGTGTWGNPGAYLLAQNDGNVVIYGPTGKPLWATNTFQAGYVAPVPAGDTNLTALINGVSTVDIKAAADPLLPALQAIAQGEWRMWNVSVPDLGLGFDAVPVGVEVRISKQAFDTIRSAVTWDTVKALADLVGKVLEAGDIEKAAAMILAGLSPSAVAAITKTAALLGITTGHALVLVIVLLIIITYQLAAIVVQVKGREFFGETFPRGLCLQHPLIAFGAIAVVTAPTTFGPFLAAQLAANTPIIVVPR